MHSSSFKEKKCNINVSAFFSYFRHTLYFARPNQPWANLAFLFMFGLVDLRKDTVKNIYFLHAEISYMIDTACHWTFFPIHVLPVLTTLNPIFFSIFQRPIFVEQYCRTYVHQCRALITQLILSAHISALFGCWFTKSALNPEIWAEKKRKFQQNRGSFLSTDASHARISRLMRHEYCILKLK